MLIPASSTEYLHVPVTAPEGVDLTGAPVRIAVVAHRDNPATSEWKTGVWDDGEATLLIGPGSTLVLTRGDYRVWVSVDPPGAENITRMSGHLGVT
ncbi:hypothetical protein [Streptomyces spectabilis]|uniref:Uncharacterized protein n=1 Tax=Streptomyces spectabilis TaxID=68270 RepID=A0A5P2X7M6_STRST|nr:hypothetical protein [Streptomyces spectabilis]MBB5108310.1 hypothetical protein [Streptomyces spectabilis]MCI3901069.1 hypothetical protein [Streptomyces spectabilis]QEV58566.1 hypothetical protein CP982_07440 [Streptomyces spectabilis]GGV45784.1 hypothetical protein GCM10010245_71720 [Streptomyces spectabilis]